MPTTQGNLKALSFCLHTACPQHSHLVFALHTLRPCRAILVYNLSHVQGLPKGCPRMSLGNSSTFNWLATRSGMGESEKETRNGVTAGKL